jgi:hypothetical protein
LITYRKQGTLCYLRGVAHRKLGNNVKADADFAKAKELGYELPDEDE